MYNDNFEEGQKALSGTYNTSINLDMALNRI